MLGPEIDTLIKLLAKLPGLGPRSARRAVLELMKKRDLVMLPLAQALEVAARTVQNCTQCGNLDSVNPCTICTDERRDRSVICVVEDAGDVWAIEKSGIFKGLYHVLGGTLSALDGVGPEDLNIYSLMDRVRGDAISEVILATNATIDGQTTAHYVTDRLQDCNVSISRLAQGVPLGGELDYLDEGTLTAAFHARRPF